MDDLEPTFDVEADADLVMDRVVNAFDAADNNGRDEYRVANDHEFYLVVVFQSREQKEEFLRQAGWDELGDKYLDGLEVAQRLALNVPPIALPNRPPPKMARGLRGHQIIKKGGVSK